MFLGMLESVDEQHPAPLSEFAEPMAIVGYILDLHSGPPTGEGGSAAGHRRFRQLFGEGAATAL
jgi:hypothetical protein